MEKSCLSLLLQEDPVLNHLMLASLPAVQLYSLLKVVNTLRSVGESLDIRLDNHKHLFLKILIDRNQLVVHMLME